MLRGAGGVKCPEAPVDGYQNHRRRVRWLCNATVIPFPHPSQITIYFDSDSESDRNDFAPAGAKWDPTGSVARCANRPLKDVLIAYYIRSACPPPLGMNGMGMGMTKEMEGHLCGSQLLLVSKFSVMGLPKKKQTWLKIWKE